MIVGLLLLFIVGFMLKTVKQEYKSASTFEARLRVSMIATFSGMVLAVALLMIDNGKLLGRYGWGRESCSGLNHVITSWVFPLLLIAQVVASARFTRKQLPLVWFPLLAIYALGLLLTTYGQCTKPCGRSDYFTQGWSIAQMRMSRSILHAIFYYVLYRFPMQSDPSTNLMEFFSSRKTIGSIVAIAVVFSVLPGALIVYPIVYGIAHCGDMAVTKFREIKIARDLLKRPVSGTGAVTAARKTLAPGLAYYYNPVKTPTSVTVKS